MRETRMVRGDAAVVTEVVGVGIVGGVTLGVVLVGSNVASSGPDVAAWTRSDKIAAGAVSAVSSPICGLGPCHMTSRLKMMRWV